MKTLYDTALVQEVTKRIEQLTPKSEPQWGKMSVSQMLAHCAISMEVALGDQNPPRMLIGRMLGPIIKPLAVGNDDPIRKNTPTAPIFVVKGNPNFEDEQVRLTGLVARFAASGPAGCTRHAHAFFGNMTPQQWAILMYKHKDHHLRQFGV